MRAADPVVLTAAGAMVAGVTFVATTIPAVGARRMGPLRAPIGVTCTRPSYRANRGRPHRSNLCGNLCGKRVDAAGSEW